MEANISISAGDSCRLSAPSSHSLKSHTGSGSSFLTPLALWYRKYMWLIQLLWVALRAPPPEATGCLCSRYVFIICHACKTEVSTPILAPFSEPSSGSPSPSYPMEYASYYFNACNWVCKPHSQLQSYQEQPACLAAFCWFFGIWSINDNKAFSKTSSIA